MDITGLLIKALEESSDEEVLELANQMIALKDQMHSDPEDYVDKNTSEAREFQALDDGHIVENILNNYPDPEDYNTKVTKADMIALGITEE